MPGDRPTHAVTIRPALVELPLWIAWRTTHLLRRARVHIGHFADRITPDTPTGHAQFTARLAIAACAIDIVAKLIT